MAAAKSGRAIVDGEICTLDQIGRSDFPALHARARRRRTPQEGHQLRFVYSTC